MVGDPKYLLHPVEIMGWIIIFLRKIVDFFAKNNSKRLRLGGVLITLTVTTLSALAGWIIEQFYISTNTISLQFLSTCILIFALASSLALKSLKQSAVEIINTLSKDSYNYNIDLARFKLSNIVGRDVKKLDKDDILRATAESASENAVDGIFAPLFWMIIGTLVWSISNKLPGPLAFAWFYKASSTIDSMIGYKQGNLLWLGQAGAILEDILTFIPCRLVLITLPLVSSNWTKAASIIKSAYKEGSKYSSPNSGLSEAIFANCAQVKMGGLSYYRQEKVFKPILASKAPKANIKSIKNILNLYLKLEILWVAILILINIAVK